MSLDFSLEKIDKWQELYTGESDNATLNSATDFLIWATMSVDLGRITESNIDEWLFRLAALARVGFLTRRSGPMTRQELQRHIGLRTNVADITHAQFMRKLIKDLEAEVKQDVKKLGANAQKKGD